MSPYSNQNWRNSEVEQTNLQETSADGSSYILRENILDAFDFPEMIEDYLIELEIRNYSANTIKTYRSIINNFYKFFVDPEEPI